MGQTQTKPTHADHGVNPRSDPGPIRHRALPPSTAIYAHFPLGFSTSSSLLPSSPPCSPASPPAAPPTGAARSSSIVRKLSRSRRTRPSAEKRIDAPLVSNSTKARKTLGEDMKAFEELVETAEIRSGLDQRPTHGTSQSLDSGIGFLKPFSTPHATHSAEALPSAIPSIPLATRPHFHRQRSAVSRSPSRASSIKSARRAEREWRAKVAAISAAAASASSGGGRGERARRRSGLVELRGGPVPPRRTAGRVPNADSASTTPGIAVSTPPAQWVGMIDEDDGTGSLFGKGAGGRSIMSRKSWDTLGFHRPDTSPTSQTAPHLDSRLSIGRGTATGPYFERTSRLSLWPSSLAINTLLDTPEVSQDAWSEESESASGGEVDNAAKGGMPCRIIIPTVPPLASPLDSPKTPLPLSLAHKASKAPQTPLASTFARSASLADSSPRAKRASESYVDTSPISIRSGRTNSLPASSSSKLLDVAGRAKLALPPQHMTRTPITPIQVRHPQSSSGRITPAPYSPTTAYILSTPAENISFGDVLMATPPRKDSHPYATRLIAPSPQRASSEEVVLTRRPPAPKPIVVPALPKTLPLQPFRPAPPPPTASTRMPLTPTNRLAPPFKRNAGRPGDPLLKHHLIGAQPPLAKGLRGVDLTPGMQDGNRPPKSGMAITDLEKWLAGTSITSS